jgi:vacuolar-type H+-ATPase subunit H
LRIVREAEAKAASMIDGAEKRTRAIVADAEDRLSQIRIERDAVAAYFEGLRGVLAQAERAAADE